MRVSLKYAVPLVQMGLAAVLMRCHGVWQMATRDMDMPGPSPSFRLLASIDWPLLCIPVPWRMPLLWYSAVSVAITGVFWYWVAVNVSRFQHRQRLIVFRSVPLGVAGDLFLILVGACFGLAVASGIVRGPLFDYPRLGSRWLWFVPTMSVQVAWFLVLIAVFGRELVRRTKQK